MHWHLSSPRSSSTIRFSILAKVELTLKQQGFGEKLGGNLHNLPSAPALPPLTFVMFAWLVLWAGGMLRGNRASAAHAIRDSAALLRYSFQTKSSETGSDLNKIPPEFLADITREVSDEQDG